MALIISNKIAVNCEICGRVCRGNAGLAAHYRGGRCQPPPAAEIVIAYPSSSSSESSSSNGSEASGGRGSSSSIMEEDDPQSSSDNDEATIYYSGDSSDSQSSSSYTDSNKTSNGSSSSNGCYHTPEEDDLDTFSIVSDHELCNVDLPQDFFNHNEKRRDDARIQRYIEFARRIMELRYPRLAPPSEQPARFEKVFFGFFKYSALFIYILVKYSFIYCLFATYYLCLIDKCTNIRHFFFIELDGSKK